MKVINLWAGPGAGKSTTAAGLFYIMKTWGARCELVTEYAKELVYEKRSMTDQLYILAQQNKRLERLREHVDWAITDSPLPLGLAYANEGYKGDWYENTTSALFNSYDNINFRIIRTKEYQAYGRNQLESEARSLDDAIAEILSMYDQAPTEIPGDLDAPNKIFEKIKGLNNK